MRCKALQGFGEGGRKRGLSALQWNLWWHQATFQAININWHLFAKKNGRLFAATRYWGVREKTEGLDGSGTLLPASRKCEDRVRLSRGVRRRRRRRRRRLFSLLRRTRSLVRTGRDRLQWAAVRSQQFTTSSVQAGQATKSYPGIKSLPTKSSNPEFLQNPPQICRRDAKFLPAYQNCPRLCRHATEILPGFKDQWSWIDPMSRYSCSISWPPSLNNVRFLKIRIGRNCVKYRSFVCGNSHFLGPRGNFLQHIAFVFVCWHFDK